MATYDPDREAWNLFVQLSNNNTWQVPALVWSQTMASMGDANLTADPRLKYVPISVRRQWELERLRLRTSPEVLQLAKKQSARERELVDIMRRAGVQFMAGSNGPDPYAIPGFSLHTELEWLVKSGFSPTQALQSATFNPALFLAAAGQNSAWSSPAERLISCCWKRIRWRISGIRARSRRWS